MNNVIKLGTVFAGRKAPDVHNEIVKVYFDRERYGNRKMVDVEQYSATLANQEHQKKITFFASEITGALRNGFAHLVLVR